MFGRVTGDDINFEETPPIKRWTRNTENHSLKDCDWLRSERQKENQCILQVWVGYARTPQRPAVFLVGWGVHTHLFACLFPSRAHVKSSTGRRAPAQNKTQLWAFRRVSSPCLNNKTGRGSDNPRYLWCDQSAARVWAYWRKWKGRHQSNLLSETSKARKENGFDIQPPSKTKSIFDKVPLTQGWEISLDLKLQTISLNSVGFH